MKLTQVVKVEGDYEILDNLAKITNGLYNSALYESSQRYKREQKFYFYYDLCNILKDNALYTLLPSQTAQAVPQKVEGAIKSFLKLRRNNANAAYPKYHKKNTAWVIPFKSQQIKIDGNILTVPMSMKYREEKGLSHIDLKIPNMRYDGIVKYIELYKTDRWYASIVIDVKEQQESAPKGNLYIDLGVRNLATVFDGKNVAIYSGGKTSSTNRYRNKKNAEQQAILSTIGKKTSKEKKRIARKALHQLKQQLHSMTKSIVQKAKAENKGIVVGNLSHIRDSANYNDNANQKIHQWQFAEITKQLFYKAKEFGIKITKISEEDTSKTCTLCGQETNGRVHRGLYRCKLYGKQFNADANGALNIMKRYLQIPLQQGSGIGVVGVLAHPAVYRWNEHRWCNDANG
ncbi:MAG: transposase [Candidatus Marsarchaeota archaeon]|nr:transposase [Candidatus Marsarchaeota archaeon]MCL5419170.1 transposase [Candidatus Marsarchaeota archaeon]